MKNGKHVVLHIDDDPEFIDSMRLILEKDGYILEAAASAEEGVKQFKETKPDFVVVDLMMEEIDSGVSFVKEIRFLGGQIPIFLLSSAADQLHASTNYADLGFDGVFQKPIEPEIILTTLKETLGEA